MCVCVCMRACMLYVMGVFPLLEDFQGSRDNVEFMRGMPHKGSFLSPDSITSCAEFPASGPLRRRVRLTERAKELGLSPLSSHPVCSVRLRLERR